MFTGYSDYSSYHANKCVSTFLNTSNWTNFVNTEYADYAIGGPTLEMWVSSWNTVYPNDKLYCNHTDEHGYYVGISNNPQEKGIERDVMQSKTGFTNKLYYPHICGSEEDTGGYWLASITGTYASNLTRYVFSILENGRVWGLRN